MKIGVVRKNVAILSEIPRKSVDKGFSKFSCQESSCAIVRMKNGFGFIVYLYF